MASGWRQAVAITLALLGQGWAMAAGRETPFYLGADLSFANEMQDCGATFHYHGKLVRQAAGLFYWAPDWIPAACTKPTSAPSNWSNAAWFDRDRNWEALPVIDFLDHRYRRSASPDPH